VDSPAARRVWHSRSAAARSRAPGPLVRPRVDAGALVNFLGMGAEEAKAFAERWLPAWTGNDPNRLAAFYTDDVVYSDPAIPSGVRGRSELVAYFTKLLVHNPNWVWSHTRSIPIVDGFLNFWHPTIPAAHRTVEADGVCTVQIREGLIYANHVFFDRSELLRVLTAGR